MTLLISDPSQGILGCIQDLINASTVSNRCLKFYNENLCNFLQKSIFIWHKFPIFYFKNVIQLNKKYCYGRSFPLLNVQKGTIFLLQKGSKTLCLILKSLYKFHEKIQCFCLNFCETFGEFSSSLNV